MLLLSALSIAARRRGLDFGKDLTALGILCRFAVFGVGPLTMTCHKKFLKNYPAPFSHQLRWLRPLTPVTYPRKRLAMLGLAVFLITEMPGN